ncbi:glycosyltransferase family 2 protein [Geminocystis herdmanii]|uniref:glycosyltransferase family 2 protein n=1 Tax=Geminocystis herdmanii TaxID=669359 RepID=UPI00034A66DE|nr:glycosyltransferase [Geminocystis herdmanii]
MLYNPKVSVIIPTYNRLPLLKEALDSVVAQTCTNWECIVVNDYPPDQQKVETILKQLNDERFILINHKVSQGGNTARNTGIRHSRGQIIAFLDDDDIWDIKKLEIHYQFHCKYPNIGLFYSNVLFIWSNNEIPPYSPNKPLPKNVTKSFLEGNFCPPTSSCVTVLSKAFNDCGFFDENLVSFQDWDMWLRISEKYEFGLIQQTLVYFRQHLSERTSQNLEKRLQGLEQIEVKWKTQFTDISLFHYKYLNAAYRTSTRQLFLIPKNQKNKIYSNLIKYMEEEYNKDTCSPKTILILCFCLLIPRRFYLWWENIKSAKLRL